MGFFLNKKCSVNCTSDLLNVQSDIYLKLLNSKLVLVFLVSVYFCGLYNGISEEDFSKIGSNLSLYELNECT